MVPNFHILKKILILKVLLEIERPTACTQQFDEITAKTDTYLQSFLPKTVRKWNKLPQEIVSAPNHNQFRAKI